MTEKTYNPYELAIELGFTEAEAESLAHAQADATNIRAVARAKGLLPNKKTITLPNETNTQAEGKPHRHHYRKDGTCRCGAVRKVKT